MFFIYVEVNILKGNTILKDQIMLLVLHKFILKKLELFKLLRHKPSTQTIHSIVKEAVEIEKGFILDALPCNLIGMNSEKMSEYIEYVSDRLLKQIGQPPIWNSKNPFDFMENISLDGKTNFFEKRVGDYGKLDDESTEIGFDEDF